MVVLSLLLTDLAKLVGQPWEMSQGGPGQRVWCFTDCSLRLPVWGNASKAGCIWITGLSGHATVVELILPAETPGSITSPQWEKPGAGEQRGPPLVGTRRGDFLRPPLWWGSAQESISASPAVRLHNSSSRQSSQLLPSHRWRWSSFVLHFWYKYTTKNCF